MIGATTRINQSRKGRFPGRGRLMLSGILVLAALASACSAAVKDPPVRSANPPTKTIYLVSHGWHAGIVLYRADLGARDWLVLEDFPDSRYLEVGWGDRDFYRTPDPGIGLIAKAALLPTTSVLHIVGFTSPVTAYFPNSEIIRIKLPTDDFRQLSRKIAGSFAKDETGKLQPLGSGIYGNSRFYLSNERYHLFNTCNVWVARMLGNAGLPFSPMRAIRVEGLMSQARRLGTAMQSGRAH